MLAAEATDWIKQPVLV